MLPELRRTWNRLPAPVRRLATGALRWTGLPYAVSFVASYDDVHRLANFAGNLEDLKEAWRSADGVARAESAKRLDAVVDRLVLANGVMKRTFAERNARALSAALASDRVRLARPEIRVLDLPASAGIASLNSYSLLSERYRVRSYVLGDLHHGVLYDPRRRCVFDEQGNLLQVAFRRRYFATYRWGASGEGNTFLASCLLFPHSVASWYLRARYRFEDASACARQLIVHPEVERRLAEGVFRLERMDVFRPIPGRYDLILSFNLLTRDYFPPERIADGVANLAAALDEGGLLLLGRTESFAVLQKRAGGLTTLLREGRF